MTSEMREMPHNPLCQGEWGIGPEDRPSCPACAVHWQEFQERVKWYRRIMATPILGSLYSCYLSGSFRIRSVYKEFWRAIKWQYVEKLNQDSKWRDAYPVIELLLQQRVWIVNNWWCIASSSAKDAEYYADTIRPDDNSVVRVRRPERSVGLRYSVRYVGGTFYAATLVAHNTNMNTLPPELEDDYFGPPDHW